MIIKIDIDMYANFKKNQLSRSKSKFAYKNPPRQTERGTKLNKTMYKNSTLDFILNYNKFNFLGGRFITFLCLLEYFDEGKKVLNHRYKE